MKFDDIEKITVNQVYIANIAIALILFLLGLIQSIYNYGFIADKNFYHAIKNLIWLFHINCFAVLVFRNRNTKALLAVLSLLALPFLYIGYVCFALVHLIINGH